MESHLQPLAAALGATFEAGELAGRPARVAAVSDLYAAIDLACVHAHSLRGRGYAGFVGVPGDEDYAPHRFYVVPGVDALSIARACAVGSHNGGDLIQVHATLARIHARCPFTVYFADPAGLKALFDTRPSEDDADVIEELVLSINIEALSLLDDDAEPAYGREMVLRRQRLELWWD